jgi:galactoside O-acetyltransferase
LKIGDDVSFGPNCVIYEWRGDAAIGNGTMIAAGVVISGVNHGMDPSAGPYRDQPTQALPVEIGSNVWIGMNSIILPGVTVGDNTIVGAGSVVTRSLPKGVIAYGNPCKTIRNVDENQDTVPGD